MKADPQASLGAAGIDELRWLKPVYPGDTLRCETEVLEVAPSRSRPDMGSVISRMTVFNQADEQVLRFNARALVRRRPASGA
jgi:acyl dehydratase